ncbi:hypothetical protein Q8A67_018786 [Cirrhinus molitorella]|uniref:Uncharacterized protein n=1 Tax=Cirrhinus molitorella TaxID=172907 RepID=A0AA88THR2_9TELE|nr:hypothetical protein Q8A67_018786 [Cirrhinus molitorella]
MDKVLGQRASKNPPVPNASIPEETSGPSSAVDDREEDEPAPPPGKKNWPIESTMSTTNFTTSSRDKIEPDMTNITQAPCELTEVPEDCPAIGDSCSADGESGTVERIHEQPRSAEPQEIRRRHAVSDSMADSRVVKEPNAQANFSCTAAPPSFLRCLQRLLHGTQRARQLR